MEERDPLALSSAATDGDDVPGGVEIEAFDLDRGPKDLGCKWDPEVLVQHREEADSLFRLVVRVDGGFFRQRLELTRGEARPAGSGRRRHGITP
jgi:hypothetical protein